MGLLATRGQGAEQYGSSTALVVFVGTAVENESATGPTLTVGSVSIPVGTAIETEVAFLSGFSGGVSEIPDERMLVVRPESRLLTVEPEYRELRVPSEDRTLTVVG